MLTLSALLATGCASWHSIGKKQPPAEYIARERPELIRLTLSDSSLVLSRPVVHDDIVVGLSKGTHPRLWTSVPASEIRGLEVHSARGTKRAKVMAVTFCVVAIAFGALAAIAGPPGQIY